MVELVVLVLALLFIVLGAELFTNGIEWTGKIFRLSEGTVGSVLAAVGTALPETMVPIIAFVFPGSDTSREAIGVGAILGAPFMLSTLALSITGLAVFIFHFRGLRGIQMKVDRRVIERDLAFFLLVYIAAAGGAMLNLRAFKLVLAAGLVVAYVIFVIRTIRGGKIADSYNLKPLHFERILGKTYSRRSATDTIAGRSGKNPGESSHVQELSGPSVSPPAGSVAPDDPVPPLALVVLQVGISLLVIAGGAHFFVNAVENLARDLEISAFVLSAIITPVATELPEKLNSIIWLQQEKDTLALGNITGAMVFQSSMLPALGIAMTPWVLTGTQLLTVLLALVAAGMLFVLVRWKKRVSPYALVVTGIFYLTFVLAVLVAEAA